MNQSVRVTGQTFDHRDRLKQMGGRWDASARNWVFDWINPKNLAELKNLPGCLVVGDTPEPKRDWTPQPRTTEDTSLDALFGRVMEERDAKEIDGGNRTVMYGDDPTYFNHFKDKNPISFFGFSSLQQIMKFVDAIPEHKRVGARDAGWGVSEANWSGSRDMEHALQIARDGWKDGADKAADVLEFLNLENAVQRRRSYSVAGGNVSVGRLLAGNPAHMIRRPKLPGRRSITLFVENTASAYINAEMLIVRASVIAALADMLEMRGYSCTIVAATMQTLWDAPAAQTAVTIKHAGEKLNLTDIVFALGHPSFLRRFNFACVSQADELKSIWKTQGSPKSAFGKQMNRNEFYVQHLRENIKGDNFIEIAKQMLPLIVPHGLPLELDTDNDN